MMKTDIKSFFILLMLLFVSGNCISQNEPNTKIHTKISTKQSHFKIDSTINITFTVTNKSDKDHKFCFWQTPIEKGFTSSYFEIILDDEIIKYTGKKIKRSPPKKKDYLLLKPKQSITGEINLLEGYDLIKKGNYTIKFKGGVINGLPNSEQIELLIE